MLTILRRMFWLSLLGGAAYGGWTVWQRQKAPAPAAPPTWPPIDTTPKAASAAATTPTKIDDEPPTTGAVGFAAVDTTPADATPAGTIVPPIEPAARVWVDPVDGECPDGYPIKANDNSGIFHVPGGRFYQRTVPERCYANADDAVADGYRAAKA